jgi:hypothetical protein
MIRSNLPSKMEKIFNDPLRTASVYELSRDSAIEHSELQHGRAKNVNDESSGEIDVAIQ